MGIYIKDMGMPKNCIECFLCKICTGKHWELTKYDTGYKWEYIKDNCLLTEVPKPHGRLIDADILDVSMFDGQMTCPNCGKVLGYA